MAAGSASYRVYVYNNGSGSHFTYKDVSAGEIATFYLVDGDYEYLVSYGHSSQRVDFTITRDMTGAPGVVTAEDLSMTYNLAQVDITVAGAGSASYRVYVYNNGSGSHFTYKDLSAGEIATFYLVDGDYEYLVSYGHSSQRVDFTITRDMTGAPGMVTAEDLSMTYNLAQVDITVAGAGSASYRVYVYNNGSGSHFTYKDVSAGETATFYLVDGDYEYLVSYGHSSQRIDFSVTRAEAPPVVTANDLSLTYNLAKIIIKVVNSHNQALSGFRVYVYNNGSGSHFIYQDTPANGEVTFYLVDGDFEYLLTKGCYNSGRVDFTVTLDDSNTPTLVVAEDASYTHKATQDVSIKVSDNDNVGHKSYLVRVYNTGGSQIAYQWSDNNGMTNFELDALGSYEYLVEKNGAQSDKKPIGTQLCGATSTEYKLAKIVVHVSDTAGGNHQSYLVRMYNGNNGSGAQWGYAWSDADGESTFYLVEGAYGYLVEKNGAQSGHYGFTVNPPASPANDQGLTYKLAKITVHVSDTAGGDHQSYLVRVYNGNNGTGSQWGYAWSNASGEATFYLIESDYGYLVEKNGAQSGKYGFTVNPPGVNANDQGLTYKLAKITVHVSDTAGGDHQSYLVRVYNGNNGTGSQWGYAWSDANGESTFYLVESDYGYLVEKNGAQSGKYGFSVNPPGANANDQELTYKLAKITVHVSDSEGSDHQSYLVRVYNGNSGTDSQWGYAWSDAHGESTFYLVESDYGYLVEKNGAQSGKYGFTVNPPGANAEDDMLTYLLALVTVHVQDSGNNPLQSYLVRMYNYPAGSQWGYQWTNASGDSTFYLIEGGYQYQVEKNSYNSGKLPPSGFTVNAPSPADNQTLTHTMP